MTAKHSEDSVRFYQREYVGATQQQLVIVLRHLSTVMYGVLDQWDNFQYKLAEIFCQASIPSIYG